ncbi:MAG: methionyl-tRNA formyltransferase [Flavobacteriaceae bacterium]|nr:MAG: methionyl-tRNA formyltransferase [Flavobacteriaceae bacterium]
MKIQLLTDNPKSWIIPYVHKLKEDLKLRYPSYRVLLVDDHEKVKEGDVLCLLACEKVFKKLKLNTYNLVVHESNLPKGKGWSPVTWQVLEGKSKIPVTLFEATDKVDSGKIYLQDFIILKGDELLTEIKHQQGIITNKLILEFIKKYPSITGREQFGEESFYKRRTAKDSELDIRSSIDKQFNLLRICDNERYPAFFYKNDVKYILKIFKENE